MLPRVPGRPCVYPDSWKATCKADAPTFPPYIQSEGLGLACPPRWRTSRHLIDYEDIPNAYIVDPCRVRSSSRPYVRKPPPCVFIAGAERDLMVPRRSMSVVNACKSYAQTMSNIEKAVRKQIQAIPKRCARANRAVANRAKDCFMDWFNRVKSCCERPEPLQNAPQFGKEYPFKPLWEEAYIIAPLAKKETESESSSEEEYESDLEVIWKPPPRPVVCPDPKLHLLPGPQRTTPPCSPVVIPMPTRQTSGAASPPRSRQPSPPRARQQGTPPRTPPKGSSPPRAKTTGMQQREKRVEQKDEGQPICFDVKPFYGCGKQGRVRVFTTNKKLLPCPQAVPWLDMTRNVEYIQVPPTYRTPAPPLRMPEPPPPPEKEEVKEQVKDTQNQPLLIFPVASPMKEWMKEQPAKKPREQ